MPDCWFHSHAYNIIFASFSKLENILASLSLEVLNIKLGETVNNLFKLYICPCSDWTQCVSEIPSPLNYPTVPSRPLYRHHGGVIAQIDNTHLD